MWLAAFLIVLPKSDQWYSSYIAHNGQINKGDIKRAHGHREREWNKKNNTTVSLWNRC